MTAAPQRLLLLSPVFHGYWRSVERALTGLGYAVTAVPYDAPRRQRGGCTRELSELDEGGAHPGAAVEDEGPAGSGRVRDEVGEQRGHVVDVHEVPGLVTVAVDGQ